MLVLGFGSDSFEVDLVVYPSVHLADGQVKEGIIDIFYLKNDQRAQIGAADAQKFW